MDVITVTWDTNTTESHDGHIEMSYDGFFWPKPNQGDNSDNISLVPANFGT